MNKRLVCALGCLVSVVAFGDKYGFSRDYRKAAPNNEQSTPVGKPSVSSVTPAFRWFQNRAFDFCDIIHLGIGATHENPVTGPLAPSFGVHAQVTDYGHLGFLKYGGASAEWEGRGFGAYPEYRSIYGFGPWKSWEVNQVGGVRNFYKDAEASANWLARMDSHEAFKGESAHIVVHGGSAKASPWSDHPRGWHNYAYTGVEVAVPLGLPYTPLDSHLGITMRLGIDTSQVFDFLLGFVGLDFWHDDLRATDLK